MCLLPQLLATQALSFPPRRQPVSSLLSHFLACLPPLPACFLPQLGPLTRQAYAVIVLPCYRLASRMARLYLRCLHRCVVRPCVALGRRVTGWCYTTLIPFMARTAVAVIEGSFRLLGRALGMALQVWRAYVLPSCQWAASRAWGLVRGVGPALAAWGRAGLRQLHRLLVQPALQAVAAAYGLVRYTLLPGAWCCVCRAVPLALDAARAMAQHAHRLLVSPALEAASSAYRFWRHTALPWAWSTVSSVGPALLSKARALATTLSHTIGSLWADIIVPTCQDLW